MNIKRDEIAAIEKEFDVKINVIADKDLLPGQYKIDVEKIKDN